MNSENQILCSIIILTYNQLIYLERTIKNITSQTYLNIEIVVSDDGTPRFNYEYVKNLCEKYCKTKEIEYLILHSDVNQGTVKNFNRGIKASKGDIIIPMAGDNCFYTQDAILKIVGSFSEKKWLVATGKQILKKEKKNIEIRPYANEIVLLRRSQKDYLAIRLAMFPCFIGGAATIYSREAFNKYGLFDEEYFLLEDCPYYVKILLSGENIEFINDILVRHNIDSKQKRSIMLIKDDIHVINQLLESGIKINLWQKHMLLYRKKCLMKEIGNAETYSKGDFICCMATVLYKIYTKSFRILSQIKVISNKKLRDEYWLL